jgi:WD40 repeat protein
LDIETGAEKKLLTDPDRNMAASLSFSPDGSLLAVGYSNGMFKIWSVNTGELLTTVQCNMGWVISVAFNPSGTLLATSSRTVVLWGIPSEEARK